MILTKGGREEVGRERERDLREVGGNTKPKVLVLPDCVIQLFFYVYFVSAFMREREREAKKMQNKQTRKQTAVT